MALNLSIKNNNLHHAYCILGNTVDVINELEKFFLKELDFSTTNNPDFWYGEFDVMNIDDSRAINILHQSRPTVGDKKIFVVSANFITEQAQNAMLKLLEEPRGDTHFFLVLPSLHNIIPTFKSRLFVIDTVGTSDSIINPKEFLKMPIGERMKAVKNICESVSDKEESKIEVINFINSLELELKNKMNFKFNKGLSSRSEAGRGESSVEFTEKIKVFEELEKVRQYAGEQSPSLKMLLEHLSLLLPVF